MLMFKKETYPFSDSQQYPVNLWLNRFTLAIVRKFVFKLFHMFRNVDVYFLEVAEINNGIFLENRVDIESNRSTARIHFEILTQI